ncbi:MAG: two-component system regulatory protein YycI [Lachnospiraceae bacterium]|nr:two-component system regulatory protein YycI [Lachnospiraceae bacterium]
MRKKSILFLLAGTMVLSLAGCAGSPENSVVKEKNLDKMLEQAENTEEGAASYNDVAKEVGENYETYQTQVKDDSLGVTVNVDARVEVPEVEKLSVYRVSQKKISQEFLDSVRNALTADIPYYEGRMENARTKAVIAKEIQETKDMISGLKAGEDGLDEEAVQQYKEEYEQTIRELEAEYETAPEDMNLTDYPSDNRIYSIQELYEKYPNDDFYEWEYSIHPDGEVYYGVSDAKDGNYHALFVQNSSDYGNCLRYMHSKNGYGKIYSAFVEDDMDSAVLKRGGETPDFTETGVYLDKVPEVSDNEPLTLSEEKARKQADEFLQKIKLTEYKCYESGIYSQLTGEENDKYRDVYKFLYMRNMDGIFVDNSAGFKFVDEWQGNEYTKKAWGNEAVVVAVNDSGIVDFRYLTPLSIDETVVEKTSIQSFQDIKDTFEQMVVIENAVEEGNVSIEVTDVKLVYTRISEKDSFDTGLVVPVWDFEGRIIDEFGYENTGNILSINAIDGTVINRRLGY